MEIVGFEWDYVKAKSNQIKHKGVTFEEAISAFEDENGIIFDDPDHSIDEDRFILLAMSYKARLLIVCHCYKPNNGNIRIISARQATPNESEQYSAFSRRG